jgi:hypothetical protein
VIGVTRIGSSKWIRQLLLLRMAVTALLSKAMPKILLNHIIRRWHEFTNASPSIVYGDLQLTPPPPAKTQYKDILATAEGARERQHHTYVEFESARDPGPPPPVDKETYQKVAVADVADEASELRYDNLNVDSDTASSSSISVKELPEIPQQSMTMLLPMDDDR